MAVKRTLGSFPMSAPEAPVAEDAPLSWRSDPAESLSDWKIIAKGPGGETKEYHAHRAILGVGKRKSDFFAQRFTGKHALRVSAQVSPPTTTKPHLTSQTPVANANMPCLITLSSPPSRVPASLLPASLTVLPLFLALSCQTIPSLP